jgi:ketosteroid isomerase-like protein
MKGLQVVTEIRRGLVYGVVMAGIIGFVGLGAARGQLPTSGEQQASPNPLMDPTTKPGKVLLFDLDAKFAKDVRERGGAAFADWFAEDGVALNNGQSPLIGLVAIAKSANWDPKVYQLTWTTLGHFEGHSKDAAGNPVTTSGRYITVWRKQSNGSWKVALDAGANEPAAAGDCCKLPNS